MIADSGVFSAVDALVEKLSDNFTPAQLYRLVAASRNKFAVPDRARAYARFNEQKEVFETPTLSELTPYRIIATTRFLSLHPR